MACERWRALVYPGGKWGRCIFCHVLNGREDDCGSIQGRYSEAVAGAMNIETAIAVLLLLHWQPITAYIGRWGFCGILDHFSGFELFLSGTFI